MELMGFADVARRRKDGRNILIVWSGLIAYQTALAYDLVGRCTYNNAN